jgi:hypothetical protein
LDRLPWLEAQPFRLSESLKRLKRPVAVVAAVGMGATRQRCPSAASCPPPCRKRADDARAPDRHRRPVGERLVRAARVVERDPGADPGLGLESEGKPLDQIKYPLGSSCDHFKAVTDDEERRERMSAAIRAGLAYFGAVFVVGFMLGAVRVFASVPRFGEIASVLLETPVILAVSWYVSGWTTRKFGVSSAVSRRLLMGVVAFALLMLAEAGVSIFAFDRSIEDHFAAYRSPQGIIGLIAQIAFAFFPLMQRSQRHSF